MEDHLYPNNFRISGSRRRHRLKQNPKLIWFTGLSGSGKSTLANTIESNLFEKGYLTYLLDGDNIRGGLNKDLGFSVQDRIENIRRIAEVSKLMMDAGLIVVAAFISPFRNERAKIADLVGKDNFLEVFVDCPIEVCEQRDVKGLYKKARAGIIKNFTGIDSPYEAPLNPVAHVHSDKEELEDSIQKVLGVILPKLNLTK
ncbi:adenylyl-sulfate kinase [Algoriphagus sediminis]|uniref:Adenylyl-sulfate kinase n=1 Tax=Algoriphagus sediminis TaxID=3057113 RepID=A0ABT7YDP9_9BACT|nr:adenylyl-sulfate kinase [Algoriphagus sediminis]MDN3204663.1 adenylyl-sulfate kinase [Algoriphagus sediminis]